MCEVAVDRLQGKVMWFVHVCVYTCASDSKRLISGLAVGGRQD